MSSLRLICVVIFPDIFSVSALNGDGITEAFDWLALQLGSCQVQQTSETSMKQTTDINKKETESNSAVMSHNPVTCDQTYSALACFFIRPNQAVGIEDDDDDDDNGPTVL